MDTITIEALVTRFKGEIVEIQPLANMYTEAQVRFDPDSEIHNYMQKNYNSFRGDMYLMAEYILPNLDIGNAKRIHLSGEAKDIGFAMGDLEVGIERMTVDWKKDT